MCRTNCTLAERKGNLKLFKTIWNSWFICELATAASWQDVSTDWKSSIMFRKKLTQINTRTKIFTNQSSFQCGDCYSYLVFQGSCACDPVSISTLTIKSASHLFMNAMMILIELLVKWSIKLQAGVLYNCTVCYHVLKLHY